ncbi:MAG: calcium-binding protein, partial [Deltaproteobacteria bacterium]|nr:calcium-binding protein [Deltaproteobacteria bacterium]
MGMEKYLKNQIIRILVLMALFLIFVAFLILPSLSNAAESLCALVKIEIRQELTLERQGFDAHMTINNGLSHISLEDVEVAVSFTDEDGEPVFASSNPDNTSALFFIREDSDGITDNGDGTWAINPVGPSTSADLHWLIIPAPGASNGLESGTLYYVGATLKYAIGGEENTTEVNPDYIYVKPMPELILDYFLPNDVYGDDAFSPEIEPPVPFSLGVRVKNTGYGTARSLRIDSAQPEIVENELGLLIGFNIQGSTVNGEAATESLLVNFGDISPNTAGVGRWIMVCTLSGRFIEFEAEFSHSDELGGELTSLIDSINTHFLVQDVLVDKSGRDD